LYYQGHGNADISDILTSFYLQTEFLDPMVVLFSKFWGTSVLFSIIPVQCTSASLVFFSHFVHTHFKRCKVVFHCGFAFLWCFVVLSIFSTNQLAIYLSFFFEKCLLRLFAHFNWAINFLAIQSCELIILCVNVILGVWFPNIFTLSVNCFFHTVDCFLGCTEFYLVWYNPIYLSLLFAVCIFGIVFRKLLPDQCQKAIYLCFSSFTYLNP
jgi:hypothetical protein